MRDRTSIQRIYCALVDAINIATIALDYRVRACATRSINTQYDKWPCSRLCLRPGADEKQAPASFGERD